MKIAVLGTGTVGQTIAKKLVEVGHDVMMGSRSKRNEKAVAFAQQAGAKASAGTFEDAATFCELAFNCTKGESSLAALKLCGEDSLAAKILIDLSNPLDFSHGMPPRLFSGNTDSLGEQIQRELPSTKVVKTLNTVTCDIMVAPNKLQGESDLFMSGNDADAKQRVAGHLREWFGWKSVIDLGDITTARGTESYIAMWVRVMGAMKTANFNIKIVK